MKIKYTFEFHKNLIITLEVSNPQKDNINIQMPHEYGGEYNLDKEIKILQSNVVLNERYTKTSKKDILIKYTFQNLPKKYDERTRMHVFMEDNFVNFNGHNGLITVDNHTTMDVSFYTNIPNFFISGFGKIKNLSCKMNIADITHTMFIISNDYIIKNNTILAYKCHDKHPFIEPQIFLNQIHKAYNKMLHFFHLKDKHTFIVSLYDRKAYNENTGTGGSGYNYGFDFHITMNDKKKRKNYNGDVEHILIYVAHEIYHHFNPSGNTFKEAWFNEGFTEFFCRLIMLSKEKFFREVNIFIQEYYLNYYKNSNISLMIGDNFWKNTLIQELPYKKGFVYALYLLQTQGDDFIKKYKKLCVYMYKHHNEKYLTNPMLKNILNDKNFDRYIIKGHDIPITTKKTITLNKIDFGFDVDKFFFELTIKSIDKNSDAYKKGLRNGKIDGFWHYYDKKERKYHYTIIQNKKNIPIDVSSNETFEVPYFGKL